MLDYRTIQAAMMGDNRAMIRIINHYEQYMRTMLMRREVDLFGNIITYLNLDDLEELKYEYMEELLNWNPNNE